MHVPPCQQAHEYKEQHSSTHTDGDDDTEGEACTPSGGGLWGVGEPDCWCVCGGLGGLRGVGNGLGKQVLIVQEASVVLTRQ